MASAQLRENKKGNCYKISVSYQDRNGKDRKKSKNWYPDKGMTQKEIMRELEFVKMTFEEEVKNWASQNKDLCTYDKSNMTFINYLNNVWLPDNYDRFSPSYRSKAIDQSKKISMYAFAKIKMRDINSKKVRDFYNELMNEKKVIKTVEVVKNVAKVFKEYNLGYTELGRSYHINIEAIYRASRGLKNISPALASRVCEKTNIPFNKLFINKECIQEYSDETINATRKIVRQVLQHASSNDVIECNYALAEKVGRFYHKSNINDDGIDNDEIVTLQSDEAKRLFERCKEEKDYRKGVAISILLLTGLRNGELCGLKWKDIDFQTNTLKVRRTTQRVSISSLTDEERQRAKYINKDCSTTIIVKSPKTDKSKREFQLGDVLAKILLDYREKWEQARIILKDKILYEEDDFLFMQENGAPIEHRTINSWLNKYLEELQIKHIRVHDLRHTNITLLINNGVPITTVSSRAGHSRTTTTLDVYAGSLKTSDEIAAQAIDDFYSNNDLTSKEESETKTISKTSGDTISQLREKMLMLKEGLITQDDYDNFKKKVLGI